MAMLRMIVISGLLPLVAALALALPGCGGGAPAPKADGTVELAPGTMDPSSESPQPAPKKSR